MRTQAMTRTGDHPVLSAERAQSLPQATMRASFEATRTTMHSGPLPRPEDVAAYEATCPGAADRIITMAEKQASHRQELERAVVNSNISNERRGQWLAFATAVLFGGAGTYLIATGKSTEGLVAIIGPLVGLVAVYFRGVKKRDAELESKRAPASKKLQSGK